MKNEITVEELRQFKGRLYDQIYLAVNQFVEVTGVYPVIEVVKTETPSQCGILLGFSIKVDAVV